MVTEFGRRPSSRGPSLEVLEENRLGNIKKELKIKELVKGDKRAGLSIGLTTSVEVISTSP